MPECCRHKCRVANQKRCSIAPGYQATDISRSPEVGIELIESRHYVFRSLNERSSLVGKSYKVTISAEDAEAQFLFEILDLPADVRLCNLEAFRRLAKVPLVCEGHGEFQFTKWEKNAHEFTTSV
jgi:hypothetical protein